MERCCYCGLDGEELDYRATDLSIYSRRQHTHSFATFNFRGPVSSPPIIYQEIPENLVLEEQIAVDRLQAVVRSHDIAPPRTAMPIGSGGEGLADAPLFLMNPDVLECYICCLPLTIPVYQCKNGHIACSPCWSKSDKLCPYCRIPKGYRRCPAMENLIESVISLCSYVKDGCTARVKHSEKRYHEKTCIFSPLCLCPHIKCYYGNKPEELYNHFSSDHFQCSNQFLFNTVFPLAILRRKATFSSEQVFFVESNEKILFVLHNFVGGDWVMVTVVCVAPISATRVFKFVLSATRFEIRCCNEYTKNAFGSACRKVSLDSM